MKKQKNKDTTCLSGGYGHMDLQQQQQSKRHFIIAVLKKKGVF